MENMDEVLRERAANIRMLVLDVDGVLTDGKLYFDRQGNESKAFNARDGLGMKALQRCGIEIAVITGRVCQAVTHRMNQLGIKHVYQGQVKKLSAFLEQAKVDGFVRDDIDSEMITGAMVDRIINQVQFARWIKRSSGVDVLTDTEYQKRWCKSNIDLFLYGLVQP